MDFINLLRLLFGNITDKFGMEIAIILVVIFSFVRLNRILNAHIKKICENHFVHVVDAIKENTKITKETKIISKNLEKNIIKIDKRLAIQENLCKERHSKT